MLEAFKKSGKNGRSQAEELGALIATCREERAALSTMLTQIQLQSTRLATAGKSLQEVDEKAVQAHTRLDQIAERLAGADARATELAAIDARIRALIEAVARAEEATAKVTAPDGELQKQKQALQNLSSQALQTRASLDSLKKEQASLDELRERLQASQAEVHES